MTGSSLHDEQWDNAQGGMCNCRLRCKILTRLGGSLALGIIATVVAVAVLLMAMTPDWTTSTTDQMKQEMLINLRRVARQKALFVKETLQQVQVENESIWRHAKGIYGTANGNEDCGGCLPQPGAEGIYAFTCVHQNGERGNNANAGWAREGTCCNFSRDKGNICAGSQSIGIGTPSCEYMHWYYPGKFKTTDGQVDSPYDENGVEVTLWADVNGIGSPMLEIARNDIIKEASLMQTGFAAAKHKGSNSVGVYFGYNHGMFVGYPYRSCSHYTDPPDNIRSGAARCYNQIGSFCPTSDGCQYDPRCRNWYALGECKQEVKSSSLDVASYIRASACAGTALSDDGQTFWMPPYYSTTGNYEITAVTPVYDDDSDALLGVVGNDVAVSALSAAINGESVCNERTDGADSGCASLEEEACVENGACRWGSQAPISEAGYSYAIDKDGLVLIHKDYGLLDVNNDSSTDLNERADWQVQAEEWTADEKQAWVTDILQAKIDGSTPENLCNTDCPDTDADQLTCCLAEYTRGGEKWYLSWSHAGIGGYIVVATLPEADIEAPAALVRSQIEVGIIVACLVLVVLGAVIMVVVFFVAHVFSQKIALPVIEIRDLCTNINDGNLDGDVRENEYGSQDVKNLKRSFRGMIVGLRFGSDEYRKGNLQKSESCFEDAMDLYDRLGNDRGIGVSQNNLATVYMHTGKIKESIDLYQQAIGNAEKLVDMAQQDGDDIQRLKWAKALSDRKGNFAALYLHTGEQKLKRGDNAAAFQDFETAEGHLLKALDMDKDIENFIGFAIKSGTLGKVYLEMGQDRMQNAWDAFAQADELITDEVVQEQEKDVGGVTAMEFAVARQHVLVNMGDLNARRNNPTEARAKYVDCLEGYANVDRNVQRRALSGLANLYEADGQGNVKESIETMMKDMGMSGGSAGPRDIVLVLDYSGSMSGGKHRAAMMNLRTVFNDHIQEDDSVMMIHFSQGVSVDFELMKKGGNEGRMNTAFDALRSPGGGTAFYDAVARAERSLRNSPNKGNAQWIIALTDGDDNRSSYTLERIREQMRQSTVNGLLIIAVGSDVSSAPALMELAKETPSGDLVRAGAGQEDIDKAFAQVIQTVNAHVVLEQYD